MTPEQARKVRLEVLARLAATADAFPHLRIGQIMANVLPPHCDGDPFYITDEDLSAALDAYTRGHTKDG